MTPAENKPPAEPLLSDWPDRLPAAFYVALDQLNRGEYFACHETLESLWIPEKRSVREVYQGVLQIAVGCYHLTVRTNWVGAVNKLEAGRLRLERAGLGQTSATDAGPIPTDSTKKATFGVYGVHWRRLLAGAERLTEHLRELGREQVTDFDRSLLPVAPYRLP